MYEKYLDDEFKFCDLNETYLEQTAQLLNQEWPRSMSLRCHTLKSSISTSADLTLPVSLLLIHTPTNKVIGHASICPIAVISDANDTDKIVEFQNLAFLQSVIVDRELRGKGLGKKLMRLCETYLIEYGVQTKNANESAAADSANMFLTTKDKQGFYESLGYSKIEPIKFYTVKTTKCTEIMRRLYSKNNKSEHENGEASLSTNSQQNSDQILIPSIDFSQLPAPSTFSPPPPPPPPLPLANSLTPSLPLLSDQANQSTNSTVNWYKKCLTQV